MKPKVYLETTMISYLTGRLSRDLIIAAHQQIAQEWWQNRRMEFDIFVSQIVINESSAGDKIAAERRLSFLESITILEESEESIMLAQKIVEQVPMSKKAVIDALHIAIAVVSGMDYLLTWNCNHIANATLRSKIEMVCRTNGYEPVIICTPEELLEE